MISEAKDKAENSDTILIRKREVPAVTKMLNQKDLQFFVENPRIYSIMHDSGERPTQEDIENKLLSMEHVKLLVQDIQRNGGLTDPIIVRDGALEVLEGNSRLAAYRALAKKDPIRWGLIKCRVIPENLEDSLVFALLGQYHITGKKDWAPFEQAGFLYRRHRQHEIEIDQLAQEIGLSKQKVTHLIKTYQFMLGHDEVDPQRWSYYDEYLKSKKIEKARLDYPDFDELVVIKIKSDEIKRAVDVRDQLPKICTISRTLHKFAKGTLDFDEAYEQAIAGGADTSPLNKVKNFRNWMAKSEVKKAIDQLSGEPRNKIKYEMKRLKTVTQEVHDRLQAKS